VLSVLVVDDVPEVRHSIVAALREFDVEILEAADGEEALHTVHEYGVDIVVSDVRMPRLDGLGLLRAIRSESIPVILHSGYADVGAAVEGLRLGAIDFLPAPIDLARLRRHIAQMVSLDGSAQAVLTGSSRHLAQVRGVIARVANERGPVLITGETGVGKEVVARAIHLASARAESPFLAINVCALPENLLESELFGHEKGSFTGAVQRRSGMFERASGGTLLLDEIGDAPARVQAQLLRVVETSSFVRVGGSIPLRSDARILAATNRDLPLEISRGRFREDLWFRLAAHRIPLQPLRQRPEDVEMLARAELARLSQERGSIPFELDASGYRRLRAHPWPGNVRELQLAVQRMAILAGERRILDTADVEAALELSLPIPDEIAQDAEEGLPASRLEYQRAERRRLLAALNEYQWNVSATARQLGLSRAALRRRMHRHGFGE
jgi:two-component system response regulator AtoC